MSLEGGVGSTCTHPECSEFDFLPAKCAACLQLFCHSHFIDHGCTAVQGGKEDRILQNLSESLAVVSKKPCQFCKELVRHLVACGDSPACSGHLFCLSHRHHAIHTNTESGTLSRRSDAATETTAAVRNRQLSAEHLLGTRRNHPLKLGRFPTGISSQGVLVALLLPSDGHPHVQQVPSVGGINKEAPFTIHIGGPATGGGGGRYPAPKLIATTSIEDGIAGRNSGQGFRTVGWNLSFVAFAQGSSLGNALDCIHLPTSSASPKADGGSGFMCVMARSKQQIGETGDWQSAGRRGGLEVFETLSGLVQDVLSQHALLLVAPRDWFSGGSRREGDLEEIRQGKVKEVAQVVMPRAAEMLGAFLPQANTVVKEVFAKKTEESAPTSTDETALETLQEKTSSGVVLMPVDPNPYRSALVYPQLVDLKFSAAGAKALGREHTKNSSGGASSVIAIAVFPLIPIPSASHQNNKAAASTSPVTLPPPFCLWISTSWPLGKVVDRIASEVAVYYDVVAATKQLVHDSKDTRSSTPGAGSATTIVGISSLSCYNLTTGQRIVSNAQLGKLLVNKDVVGLYLGGDGLGLPQSVCEQLRPLIESGGMKGVSKSLKIKMMKECSVM